MVRSTFSSGPVPGPVRFLSALGSLGGCHSVGAPRCSSGVLKESCDEAADADPRMAKFGGARTLVHADGRPILFCVLLLCFINKTLNTKSADFVLNNIGRLCLQLILFRTLV